VDRHRRSPAPPTVRPAPDCRESSDLPPALLCRVLTQETVNWERIFASGEQLNRWPFDAVVAFVFRHRPCKPRGETGIIEVGFGTGNNLWFAAAEGFEVAGVEASPTAVQYARRRLAEAGLHGCLRVGDFRDLPFESERFDLAIDRAALSYVDEDACAAALQEVHRVLRPRGKLLFTPYSAAQTSRTGAAWPLTTFYDEARLGRVIGTSWRLVSTAHVTTDVDGERLAQWQLIVEKIP
jgi:SAM-dependent methyltransferase